MEYLKYLLIIVFVLIIGVLIYFGRKMMHDYRHRLNEHAPYRKIKNILDVQAQVVEQSQFRDEIRSNVAESYLYILDRLHRRRDPDINTPVQIIDLENHPLLKKDILPYLSNQVYHDLEPLDKTLLRFIDYYNEEVNELMSIFDLLVLVVKTTPPSLYGNDNRITDQVHY